MEKGVDLKNHPRWQDFVLATRDLLTTDKESKEPVAFKDLQAVARSSNAKLSYLKAAALIHILRDSKALRVSESMESRTKGASDNDLKTLIGRK